MRGLLHNILLAAAILLMAGMAQAKSTRCFLHGNVSSSTSVSKSKSAVTDMRRMNFDQAKTEADCFKWVEKYCRYNVTGEGDVPVSLKAYFSDENSRRTNYSIDSNCIVKRSSNETEED